MTSTAEVPQTDGDTGPVTLINVFEIDSDRLELFPAEWRKRAEFMTKRTIMQRYFQQSAHRSTQEVAVTAHPAIYAVALEVTAPELPEHQTFNE